MLKEVFPIAVGPIMVIRYFIVFSPDGNGNPGGIAVFFLGVKERPEEAPFKP